MFASPAHPALMRRSVYVIHNRNLRRGHGLLKSLDVHEIPTGPRSRQSRTPRAGCVCYDHRPNFWDCATPIPTGWFGNESSCAGRCTRLDTQRVTIRRQCGTAISTSARRGVRVTSDASLTQAGVSRGLTGETLRRRAGCGDRRDGGVEPQRFPLAPPPSSWGRPP